MITVGSRVWFIIFLLFRNYLYPVTCHIIFYNLLYVNHITTHIPCLWIRLMKQLVKGSFNNIMRFLTIHPRGPLWPQCITWVFNMSLWYLCILIITYVFQIICILLFLFLHWKQLLWNMFCCSQKRLLWLLKVSNFRVQLKLWKN